MFLDVGGYLTAWVADLADDQTAMCLASSCEFLESLEPFTLWRLSSRNYWIAGCLQVVVFDHDVAGKDYTDLSFAPALVDVDQIL